MWASFLRSWRVSKPCCKRSNIDFLRRAMSYSSMIELDSGSARLAEITNSPTGTSRAFFKATLFTNPCIAESRSHAERRAPRHQTRRDHSLPPEPISIATASRSFVLTGFHPPCSASALHCWEAAAGRGPAPPQRSGRLSSWATSEDSFEARSSTGGTPQ